MPNYRDDFDPTGLPDFETYVKIVPRLQRYRDADKTFRFLVYLSIEKYILVALFLGLIAIWIPSGWVRYSLLATFALTPLAILLHYGSLTLSKPWIMFAKVVEGMFVWGLFVVLEWMMELDLSNLWMAGIYVFVSRYWQAGENELNKKAYDCFRRESADYPPK